MPSKPSAGEQEKRDQLSARIFAELVVKLVETEHNEFSLEGKICLPPIDVLAKAAFDISEIYWDEKKKREELGGPDLSPWKSSEDGASDDET
jgi:hypothetical protein